MTRSTGVLPELGTAPVITVFHRLASSPQGLTEDDADFRLRHHGDNHLDPRSRRGAVRRAWAAVRSPFVALLTGLGTLFALVGDVRGAITVAVIVLLSVTLRFWQQARSERAVSAIFSRVVSTATVRRRAAAEFRGVEREVPTTDLVPGDVVMLAAGDVVHADLRIVAAANLVVDQSAISGEALPVAKHVPSLPRRRQVAEPDLMDLPAVVFAGTSVLGGSATAVVVATGRETYFGSLTVGASSPRTESSFDAGVRGVGRTLIRFMLVMAPIVLVVNGAVTGNWAQATMFAVAVAVGLTPELLPVIVTTTLARGAQALSRRQVLVKRLNAIQDLAAMDVLCVDKTGTLTEDRVAYAHSLDPEGRPDGEAAEHAHLAVRFQTARPDRLDEAVIAQLADADEDIVLDALYVRVAELSFDHSRRRATVVLRRADDHVVITKGDPDEVLPRCSHARCAGETVGLTPGMRAAAADLVQAHAQHGMRLLAVAARDTPARLGHYTEADETGMILVGFVGFVDPVREGAAQAIEELARHGVAVKILTGDNRHAAAHVATQAGVPVGQVVLGSDVEGASDAALRALARRTTVFARLAPAHKARLVAALRADGHAVGFLGDGVNDVVALRTADVGLAPDTATEAARAAADLVLLERDLDVLVRGVVEGRRTLSNTLKYVHITAASNFGNVLTVLAASAVLQFLPILPIQLVIANVLYDLAQLALAWDRVDEGYLRAPRRWDARGLTHFMLVFGPLSSVFDVTTFSVLWWVFAAGPDPTLFRTGWFLESLLSQLLIVLVLRSLAGGARPTRPVLAATLGAGLAGVLIPLSPLAGPLRMQPLPGSYFIWLALVLVSYALTAHLVKILYVRRHPARW